MRKTVVLLVSLLFLCSLSTLSFVQNAQGKTAKKAESNVEIIRGKVVSVDQATKIIVVKDNKTQTDRTFVVSEKAIKVVKVGDEVKVKVKVGSTHAESVKIVKSEPKKK